MIRAAILTLFALMFLGQPAETWYFAQMIDSGEIVAFTMDGTVRPTSVKGDWQYGLRVDAETVLLAIAPEGEATSLYRVTPDGADRIATPESDGDFREPLAFAKPYVVLRQNTTVLPTPTLLVDSSSAQAALLTGTLPAIARISADGSLLRYMSVDGNHWSLIERTLASGAERVVGDFTADNPLPLISADTHGDRWLYQTRDESGAMVYNLLPVDGERSLLDAGTREQPLRWSFLNDALIGNPFRCGDACALRVVTAEGKYTLPLPADDVYTPLAEPEPGALLALGGDRKFWLLKADAEPLLVGQYDPTLIFMPASQLVSPDARYVLTNVAENRYAVWDLRAGTPVVTLAARYVGLILYNDQGFLVHSYGENEDNGLAYRYVDGASLTLPHTDVGLYFDLLPDGTLVYMLQKADDAVGEPGIYRYDAAAETYTPILPGARLTYPQALG